ncbi:MAG: choice-of-anchor D domain-containing protein [Bdellovibrionales bacterium]|nr:choice-of-anchor D domain-containing protein [Bdellovibrionales bacterium]
MRFFTLLCLLVSAPLAQAYISVNKSSVFLRAQAGGGSASDSVWVRNNGNQQVHLSSFDSCFGSFYVSSGCIGLLAPGSSCTIHIRYSPRTRGTEMCSITINSSGPGGSARVSVSGSAY